MACCVIGCKCSPDEISWEIPLEFKNQSGAVICTKIEGCKQHMPPDIFKSVTPEQKIKNGGW